MTFLELTGVYVEIPIYDYSARRLTKTRFNRQGNVEKSVVPALRDISLRLCEGDRLGIVGPNGAGKTSLLRLLAGIYAPTKGVIRREGKITSLLDVSFGIEPDLTGRESILLRGAILGIPRKEIVERMSEITEFSGLGKFIDLPTRTYSSGMFLRLAFSISIMLSPEILIMDEWLSVGDAEFQKRAGEKLLEIVGGTPIMVIASHSRELIQSNCNRAIWIENGAVRGEGSPEEICGLYFG